MMLYKTTKELKITKMSHKTVSVLSGKKERVQHRFKQKLIECRKAKEERLHHETAQ